MKLVIAAAEKRDPGTIFLALATALEAFAFVALQIAGQADLFVDAQPALLAAAALPAGAAVIALLSIRRRHDSAA